VILQPNSPTFAASCEVGALSLERYASLSPRGRGREAMTYGRVRVEKSGRALDGATVSHSAELARGDFVLLPLEGPLIRPFGAPSPQGEKGVDP
jgi:hypothetical protein